MPFPVGANALVALLLGYLLGSIPFGVILTRLAGFGDIRAIGSGNIGATNVLRTGNKALAAATLLGDGLKGTAAVLIAGAWLGPAAALIAGFGAFLGHIFPVWLGFKGGKGVATYLGVLVRPGLAGRHRLRDRVAGRCRDLPHLLACRPDRQPADADRAVRHRPRMPWLFFSSCSPSSCGYATPPNIRRLVAGTESRIGEKR